MCFFFSSRRRHTRFDCDWSSDVCSSDLRDGLPGAGRGPQDVARRSEGRVVRADVHVVERGRADRKSTRLNSSHSQISYAVFCLKKKKYKGTAEPNATSLSRTRRGSATVA